jgi:diadenosine tetraphosphatase ApaH/serine/threonine PP2A family protein phosphatase
MNIEDPRRIAVFSDIHGNLHALQAVLGAIDQMKVPTLVCCGDVVGYGAFPNECIEILRFRGIPTLAGNHDHAAIGWTDTNFFNEIARAAVLWTRERLSADNLQWLRERPFTHELSKDFYFVHASPYQPEQWGYVLTFGDARLSFEQFPHRCCFIGHSHQPSIVVQTGGEDLDCPEGAMITIQPDYRYLINVGSVGQPRDRNPDASFVTADLDAGQIIFHRVAYDIDAAQEAIRRTSLPAELAERLAYGWSP